MSEKAYDNTVLGEGGYSDANQIDLNQELTGENTTSSLLDAILPGIPLVGLGIKGGKSIPWAALLEKLGIKGGKVAWSQAAKNKFSGLASTANPKGLPNQYPARFFGNDEGLKNVLLSNEPRMAFNKALAEGLSKEKAIEKVFARRPDGSYFMKGNLNTDKYTLDMQGNLREIEKNVANKSNWENSFSKPLMKDINIRKEAANLPSFAEPRLEGVMAKKTPTRLKIMNFIKDKAPSLLPFLYGGAGGVAIDRTFNSEGGWGGSLAGKFMERTPRALRPDPKMPSREEINQYIKENTRGVPEPANMWEYYGDIFK